MFLPFFEKILSLNDLKRSFSTVLLFMLSFANDSVNTRKILKNSELSLKLFFSFHPFHYVLFLTKLFYETGSKM